MTRSLLTALLAASLALAPLTATAGVQIAGKPSVKFIAEGHPGALDIEGLAGEVVLTEEGDQLVLRVPMKAVDTGIDLRNEHMNEKYVDVAKFPDVVLRIPAAALTWPEEKGASSTGTTEGTFTAHGVDKPVTVAWSLKKSKEGWQVKGNFDFDVSQHGIEIPSYLGVTVEPKMKAEARFDIVKTGE